MKQFQVKQKIVMFVLCYLRFFARLQLKKNKNCKIVGITGSAGKSSTRNAIYCVLKNKYAVKASFGANSESGISLNILGLAMHNYSKLDWLRVMMLAPIKLLTNFQKFDYYLVEMGIDSPNSPKNMDFLLSIVQPKMAVFLNANFNHSFAFDSLVQETDPQQRKTQIIKLIAQEKAKLVQSLPKTGFAFLNFDDINIKELSQNLAAESYSFGSDNMCDLQIMDYQTQIQAQAISSQFTFRIQSHYGKLKTKNQNLEIKIKNFFLPKHYAYSFAPAILIGLKAGLSNQEIQAALEKQFTPPLGRASVLQGKNHSLIIDSSYNASSMKDFIELVGQSKKTKGRKLALLGDMRELGEETKQIHEEIALLAAKSFDQVFLLGKEMQRYAQPIIDQNGHHPAILFTNAIEAGLKIANLLQANDLILVKGSQNTIFLEEAVKKMLQNEKEAEQVLCRQSPWWLNVKRQAFAK
ncbi:MAG TPA: Mur ligase family protein [Candidatus Woesebacteria bacterium]|nr:Mur ligase family protein [Candidatus Woesebacteria bacterium]